MYGGEQLARAVTPARLEPPRRTGKPFPDVALDALEQQHFAARRFDRDPRRHDLGVVDHGELAVQLFWQLREPAVANRSGRPLVDEEPRVVAPRGRMLRNQPLRQRVLELRDVHPTATVTSL